MTHHSHDRIDGPSHDSSVDATHDHEAGLADLLDLDAEVLGSYLDDVTAWVAAYAPDAPGTIVDIGAGTGTGSFALAARFPSAEVLAIDRSLPMLERIGASALERGLTERIRPVRADLDESWPELGGLDVAWAASSLHEFADPDRVLRDVHAALKPDGLLVAIEMDTLPRFLPDDIGLGRPGLEARCHEILAHLGWNAHPNWRPQLERAGFEIVGERSFAIEQNPASPSTGRYADAYLRRIRSALEGRLAADDLGTLDQLLDAASPAALVNRTDLTVGGSRTVWAARR